MSTISSIQKDEQRIEEAFLNEHLYTLQRLSEDENHIQIFVSILPTKDLTDSRFIFGMDYEKDVETGKKYRKIFKITKSADEEVWKTELDQSTDLSELSQNHYFKLKHFYNKAAIERWKTGSNLEDSTDDSVVLEMLKYIETLEIDEKPYGVTGDNIFYARAPPPLSTSAAIHKSFMQIFVGKPRKDVVLIPRYQFKEFVYLSHNELNNEKLLKFKAARLFVDIGELTSENIADFIESWKKGKIRKNFEWCVWSTRDSKFDKTKLWNLLSGSDDTSELIEFEQRKKNGRIARLHCTESEIRFFSDEKPKVVKEKSFSFSRLSQKIQNVSKTMFKSPVSEKSK